MCLRVASKPIRRYSTFTIHTCCFHQVTFRCANDAILYKRRAAVQVIHIVLSTLSVASHFVFFGPTPIAHISPSHVSRSSVGEFVGDILPTIPSASGSSETLNQLSWCEALHLPSRFLEHASSLVGDFLVHATLLGRVDFALAEFLLRGVEA